MATPEKPEIAPSIPLGRIGRYVFFEEIAAGGTATVYMGKIEGATGFARVVALKRLHGHIASLADSAAMMRDEAWLTTRIRHPNVVSVVDVVEEDGELVLVMEFVEGAPLSRLLATLAAAGKRLPAPIAGAILGDMLDGLEAAHRACAEDGTPLDLIHRDVSPSNVLIGIDGAARLVDFGIAKAYGRMQSTTQGEIKGKFAYMAPEQATAEPLTARTDIYAAGVVFWECLAGRRLHFDVEVATILTNILYGDIPSLSEIAPELPPGVDALASRALARKASDRFASAAEMAAEVERVLGRATRREVASYLVTVLGAELDAVRARRTAVELGGMKDVPPLGRRMKPIAPDSGPDGEPTRSPRDAEPAEPTAPSAGREADAAPGLVAGDASRSGRRARLLRRASIAVTLGIGIAGLAAAGVVVSRRTARPQVSAPAASAASAAASLLAGTASERTGGAPEMAAPGSAALPPAGSSSSDARSSDARSGPRTGAQAPHRPASSTSTTARPPAGASPMTSASASTKTLPEGLVGIPTDRE